MSSADPERVPFIPVDVLPVTELKELTPIKGGFSSVVYRSGSQILKFTRFVGTPEDAQSRAAVLQNEHDLIVDAVGEEYTPSTVIRTVAANEQGDKARVLTTQPFVEGVVIGEALDRSGFDATDLLYFLRRSIRMYEERRKIPDIAHIEHLFRFSKTPNLIVNPDNWHPTLVDINFGRTQRRPYIGEPFSFLISIAARRALSRLE